MSEKVSDVLGLKSVGDAALKVVEGVGAFLGRICLPVAEEYGLHLRDKVHRWRNENLVKVAQIAEQRLNESDTPEGVAAHPRLVAGILEHGSWTDDPELQSLWGGLLASSCSETGMDDSNVLFMDLLSGLTSVQARVLSYACVHATKFVSGNGLLQADYLIVTKDEVCTIAGTSDIDRLDRELDRLRSVGLIEGGLSPEDSDVNLTPLALGMHFYVRCQGIRRSPIEYFGVSEVRKPAEPRTAEEIAYRKAAEAATATDGSTSASKDT